MDKLRQDSIEIHQALGMRSNNPWHERAINSLRFADELEAHKYVVDFENRKVVKVRSITDTQLP